jgi:hypothetical protein
VALLPHSSHVLSCARLEYAKFFATELPVLSRAVVDLVVAIAAIDEPLARPQVHHQIACAENTNNFGTRRHN